MGPQNRNNEGDSHAVIPVRVGAGLRPLALSLAGTLIHPVTVASVRLSSARYSMEASALTKKPLTDELRRDWKVGHPGKRGFWEMPTLTDRDRHMNLGEVTNHVAWLR